MSYFAGSTAAAGGRGTFRGGSGRGRGGRGRGGRQSFDNPATTTAYDTPAYELCRFFASGQACRFGATCR